MNYNQLYCNQSIHQILQRYRETAVGVYSI